MDQPGHKFSKEIGLLSFSGNVTLDHGSQMARNFAVNNCELQECIRVKVIELGLEMNSLQGCEESLY